MNSIEKYNCIISEIERLVEETSFSDRDVKKISDNAFAKAGLEELDERSRNEIFKFLLGETISQYITRRMIMLSYRALMAQVEYDCEELKRIVGISSDSALYNKYKEYFGMTPKDAFERKIGVKYESPRYWNDLSNEGKGYFVECTENEVSIPIETVVHDRRPYVFLTLVVLVITLFISLTTFYAKRYERWGGQFDVFCKYVTEVGTADFYCAAESVLYINPIFNTIKLVNYNSDKVIYRGKIGKITSDSITWKWNGQEEEYFGKYNAENGSIECGGIDLGEDSINIAARLFQADYYMDIYTVWTGTFSTFASIGGTFDDLDTSYIHIDTDIGSLMWELLPDEKYVFGNITSLSEDSLRFTIPSLYGEEEFTCDYHEGGYFESNCPLFCPLEDVDIRFYRITRDGVSKFTDVQQEIMRRGQEANGEK